MIKFKEITIEGFGSIQGPLTIKFNTRGLVIIRGENGVGKTTILSALVWCMYKELIKRGSSVLTWEHKRPKNYRGVMVSVSFDREEVSYEIIRCCEYTGKIEGVAGKNRVFLYKNNKLGDDKGVKDINQTIIGLLGMTPSLFCTSILFGQKMQRLIEMEGPKKKQVLEEAFEVTYINKAQDLAKKERDKKNKEYIEQYRKLTGLTATLTAKQSELENMRVLSTNFEENRELRIHHQWLSEQGLAHLESQIHAVTAIARSSMSYSDFKRRCESAFAGTPLQLGLLAEELAEVA